MVEPRRKIRFPNGLRAFFLPQKNALSGIGVGVNAAPYLEESDKVGISHLLEHLISRLPSQKSLRQKIFQKGGRFSASTSSSQTFFYTYCFSRDFEKISKIFIEGIFHPKFSEGALSQAKEAVISETAYTAPLSYYEVLRGIMWKDKRLSKPLLGSKDSVYSIKLKDIKKYHQKNYISQNVAIVVMAPKFSQEIEALFLRVPEGKGQSFANIDTRPESPNYRVFQEKSLHSSLTFAFPTRGYKKLAEERHAFNLATEILKNLYVSSLGELGLIYEASLSWNLYPNSGELVISFDGLEEEHVIPLLKRSFSLISKWPRLEISKKQFSLLKKQRILALHLSSSLEERLPLLTRVFSSGQGAHYHEEAIKYYRGLGLKDTFASVAKILLTEKPFIVVGLSLESLKYQKELVKILESFYRE